jgi:hypothetical protein
MEGKLTKAKSTLSNYDEFYKNYTDSIDGKKSLHRGLTGQEKIRVRRLYQELGGKQTMHEIESGMMREKKKIKRPPEVEFDVYKQQPKENFAEVRM